MASYVLGVAGLDDLYLPHALDLRKPQATPRRSATPRVVTGGPQPCSTAVTDAPDNDAYTADQIASAYNFSSLYGAGDEGAGITVALFELEPDLTSDIAAYQSCYGTSATVNYIEEDGGAGSGAGSGEAALDIEDIIGLAPLATIDVYQAPNSGTGLIDNYTAIVDKDTAQVVSTSWGLCESEAGSAILSEEATLFEQAATQGQSVFAAAGDDGSTDCQTNSLAVDDPGSQPYVTSVGGTTLSALGPPPSETVWNESSNGAGAGGGGISSLNTMPSYQSSAPPSLNVINANSSGSPCGAAPGSYCREVPDVSANADPYTGYLIYYEGSWTGIGGTSAAAPLWAAYSALVDASSACGGKRVGFANPALYDAAASHYSSDYHDITSGNNDYTPEGYERWALSRRLRLRHGLGTRHAEWRQPCRHIVRRGQPAQHRDGHQPRQPDHDRRRLGQLADQGQGLGRRRLELLGRRSAPRPVDQHLRSRHRHADHRRPELGLRDGKGQDRSQRLDELHLGG